MPTYAIQLTRDALRDIQSIHAAVLRSEGEPAANRIVGNLLKACESLRQNPERGSWPSELLDFGNRKYRQLQIKPYRLIYQIADSGIYIHLVADSRRNLAPLLTRRLLHT